MRTELDRNGLFLEVLSNLDPDLSETLRIEKELSGGPVEIVSVMTEGGNFEDLSDADKIEANRAIERIAGGPAVGRIVIRSTEQQAALLAAERISAELGSMYERAHVGGKVSWKILFLGVLGRIDPDLFETLKLEAEVSGHPVEILMPEDEVERDGSPLGTVALTDESQAERAHYAASVASELQEMFERFTVEKPRRRWFQRR